MAIRGTSTPPCPIVPLAALPQTDGTSALSPEPACLPLEGTVIDPTDLVKIEPDTAQALFTVPGALQPMLDAIASAVRSVPRDATTDKGRAAIKSLAYKIAQAKTRLSEKGVELNRELKALPTAVDRHKKAAVDFLDALQAEIRQPVTAWEAEQARIAEEARLKAEAEALAKAIESDHEIAMVLNRAYDRDKQEEAERMERAIEEREREIAAEAAEKERQESAQREADARAAAEKAEREKVEAEQRAKEAEERAEREKKESQERAEKAKAEAAEREKRAAEEAIQKERERQAAAKKAEDDATAARVKDQEHRKAFNLESLADLMRMVGLDETQGKAVISAIAMGKVRHISINY